MISSNLRLVTRAVQNAGKEIDLSARAARDEMMNSLIQLSKEEIKGRRPKGQKAIAGQPPMNRTGNLRRSIKGDKFRQGFASYSAIVGPTIVYGRAVEMGGEYAPPSWRGTSAMKGFPYMQPAFKKFQNQIQSQIILKHFGRIFK